MTLNKKNAIGNNILFRGRRGSMDKKGVKFHFSKNFSIEKTNKSSFWVF